MLHRSTVDHDKDDNMFDIKDNTKIDLSNVKKISKSDR